MSMITIKIIRHSERLDYSHPFYWLICFGHYWADPPLTPNGHKIAQKKGTELISNDFNPQYIYTSPYTRTMATAVEIKSSFPHARIEIESLLSEYQPNYKHAVNLYPDGIPTTYNGEGTEFIYPETYDQFSKRVQFIIKKIIEKGNDCIIVSHGELLKSYVSSLQNQYPDLLLDIGMAPYLTTLTFKYDTIHNKINEMSIKIE